MSFYKTIGLTSVYTAINILAILITTKVTSKINGPEGTALLGQFASTIGIITLLATGAIGTGVIKLVAQYKNNPQQLQKYLSTAFGITLLCSGIMALFVLIFYKWLGLVTFKSSEYNFIFLFYGSVLILNTFNSLFIYFLNGFNELRKLTIINITISIVNLILNVILCIYYGVKGNLLCNMITQTLIFFIILLMLKKMKWLNRATIFGGIDLKIAKEYSNYTAMSVFGLIPAFTILLIRNYIIDTLGLEKAGLWQGINSISTYYLSFITSVLGVYYLPKLTELKDDKYLLTREIRKGYKRIVPLTIALSFGIWLCKDIIIHVLLAPRFLPMRELFTFFMIGNVLKIIGYIIYYMITIRTSTKKSFIIIVTMELVYYFASILLIDKYGLIGTSYAFAVYMLVYMMLCFYFLKDILIDIKKSIAPNKLSINVKNIKNKVIKKVN